MGIWIHNYNTNPSIKNSVDLYLYSDEPAVYPTFKTAPIIDYNPNVFTNSETIEVNGEITSVKIDFSGVSTFDRRLGDSGNVTCGIINCLSTPWPHCDGFFTYTSAGDQIRCFQGGCDSPANCYQDFINPLTGLLKWPFNIIDPQILDNAKYWNDVNLWHNGSYLGNILVEHDGLSYENGGYEYLISVGHPITTTPCSGNSTFGFFDPETKSMIYREFMCPCLAFESSEPFNFAFCTGDDTPLSNDEYRLWVMVRDQEPIPNSIKRYKLLKGRIPNNFPVYGWHNSHRISKAIVKTESNRVITKPDRSIPGSFGFNQNTSFRSNEFSQSFSFGGQGDDGAGQFTVTPDGETVFVAWHDNSHGAVLSINQSTAVDGPGRCNDELFYKDPETNTIEFNSWCLPSVYHPEEVIDNYPENDPIQLASSVRGAATTNLLFSQINQRLEELGKPKIIFYQFPNTLTVTSDDINLPSISDLEENFPLKDYPYLSRESKNSFYENSNLIVFEQRKMLQASELNELQEKFYRKQKLFIEYSRNWLSKKYLNSTNKDILGISLLNNYTKLLPHPFTDVRVSTIIPFDEDSVDIIYFGPNNYSMVLKPNLYMLHSNYRQGNQDETILRSYLTSSTYCRNIDFIKINEEITIPLNISNTVKIPATPGGGSSVTIDTLGIVNIDIFNLIDCVQYSDLKDNSGGSNTNAPCGAKRNLLITNNSYSLNNEREAIALLEFNEEYFSLDFSLSPLNSVVSPKFGAPHMAFYCVLREGTNNLVDVFLPNGFLVQTIQKI